jgi:hypothetical protein
MTVMMRSWVVHIGEYLHSGMPYSPGGGGGRWADAERAYVMVGDGRPGSCDTCRIDETERAA